MELSQISPQKQLVQALHERGDQVQQQFYTLISNFKNDILTYQSAHSYIVEILQHDRRSLELFNQNLPEKYHIKILSRDKLTEFINYIIEFLETRGLDANLLENLTTLFQVFMESLSTRCFYSYEHLTEAFLEKIFEYEIEKNVLNDELLGLIEAAVEAYKASRPVSEEPVKEETVVEVEEPKPVKPQPVAPVEVPKVKKNSTPVPPIKEKFSCLDDVKQEQDIIEFLERRLGPEDFSAILKLIFLYYKNVITYIELIDTSSEILGNLEKDALAMLRLALESREAARLNHNPFVPRSIPLKCSDFNQSYKELVLHHEGDDKSILNHRLVCLARGAEGGNNDSGGRRHMKNQYEEELLKLEDELHEFDNMIQQFEIFRIYLQRIQAGGLTRSKQDEYIKKLLNSKIIYAIYGSKASNLASSIMNMDRKVIALVIERFTEQINKLLKAKSEYRAFWRSTMEDIYYRALDVLSNTYKLEEKKMFVNREMIDELKESKKMTNQQYRLYSSTKAITREAANEYSTLEMKSKRFSKPAFIFKLGHKNVAEDATLILRLWLSCSKLNLTEKEKANTVISKLAVGFFGITEKKGKFFADLMNEETDLIAEILEVHEKTKPKNGYKYFNEYEPLINEQKLPELYTLLTSLEPFTVSEPETAERTRIPNSMAIKYENHRLADKIFFASHTFYFFYRYFFCIVDRFAMVYDYSHQTLNSDEIYLIFIKLLILNIQGSLSNQHYEDSLKLILGNKTGLLLNFDKFCQSAFKLNFNDDFANFVLESNKRSFGTPNSESIREDILFAKSCYKLNELVVKNLKAKSSVTNSASFNVNSNEILKFELGKSVLIIHKFKSIYQDDSRFTDTYQGLIDLYKSYLYKVESVEIDKKRLGVSDSNISLHINSKRKEPVFNQYNQEDVIVGGTTHNLNRKDAVKERVRRFREARTKLFDMTLNN